MEDQLPRQEVMMRAAAVFRNAIITLIVPMGMIFCVFGAPSTTVSFNLNDVDNSSADGTDEYDILNVEGCHLGGEPGLPLLPFMAVNFVIPRGQGVSRVRVRVEAKERVPGSYYLYPVQPPRPTGDGFGDVESVGPDEDVYGSTKPFPGAVVEKGRTTMTWGWKTYQVKVWPLEYIPATREVWLYQTVNISLELSPNTEDEQEILGRSKQQHEDWAEQLEQVVANPEDVLPLGPNAFSPITGPGRWVLILPGIPEHIGRDTWESTFQPLITHRQNQGLDVEHIYVGQITSASGEAAVQDIRNYLHDQHEDHGARWACLVGDDEMIPWTYENPTDSSWGDWGEPNDWCYCDLDGAWPGGYDWAPELWVGRIPCITKAEGTNFINKVLVYEQPPDPEYLNRAFYEELELTTCEEVIEHQDPGISYVTWHEETDPPPNSPCNPSPCDWEVVAELSETHYNYVVVHSHGYYDVYKTTNDGAPHYIFDLENVQDLWNENYYFFWYSIVCFNGGLHNPDLRTLAEGLTCMYPSLGAVAFAGNTAYGDFVHSTDLNSCAWDMLFPMFVPRYFNHAGSVEARSKWWSAACGFNSEGDWRVRYNHNLFGDPATGIWTPRAMPSSQKPLTAEDVAGPLTISLLGCDPAPSADIATLRYALDRTAEVRIGIYDISGRLVQDMGNLMIERGERKTRLDCSALAPGSYIIRLNAGGETARAKMIVLR